MVWRKDMQHYACEAAKIAPIIVPYVQGRCLDIGPGHGKVWPQCIGIDLQMDQGRPVTDICGPGDDLSLFADESCDGVFSSHFLEDIARDRVADVLNEWARVIRPGGYLTLYVPSANHYPPVGDEYANPAHKWNIYPGDIEAILKRDILDRKTHGWELLISEERAEDEEYSLLIVLRKLAARGDWHENVWQRNPDGKPRALVIRYAAIGDAILAASILPHLKAQGYHVTFNTKDTVRAVLEHDPNIDEWMIQGQDFVPNSHLGPYWAVISKRYDKVINLSESIEGLLLTLPGRLNHAYPDESRRALYDHINYMEHTHNIAAVPHEFSGARFHATEGEREWAQATRERMGAPVVVWCVNGSSNHKVWPWIHIVSAWLIERTPAHIVLYGDPGVGRQLCDAILETVERNGINTDGRMTSVAGKWAIRLSLSFAQVADVVVGPETGPLNAVAMEDVPKVIYLSHSSPDNLTKHWRNTTTLLPDTKLAPCFPCHRLHYDWTHCFRSEQTYAAMCASSISPETVFKAIALAIGGLKAAA